MLTHEINEYGICSRCGCSKEAIDYFGFKCEPSEPSTNKPIPVPAVEKAPWWHEALRMAGWTISVLLLFLAAFHAANLILVMVHSPIYRIGGVALEACLSTVAVFAFCMATTACEYRWSGYLFFLFFLLCLIAIIAGTVWFFKGQIPHAVQMVAGATFVAASALFVSIRIVSNYRMKQEWKRCMREYRGQGEE